MANQGQSVGAPAAVTPTSDHRRRTGVVSHALRRVRRHLGALAGGVSVVVLLLLAVDVGLHYVPVVRSLQDGRDSLLQAETTLRDVGHISHAQVLQTRTLLVRAESDFGDRSSLVDNGLLMRVAAHLPWLGGQVDGVRALRRSGQDAVAIALELEPIADQALTGSGSIPAGSNAVSRLVAAVEGRPESIPRLSARLDHLDRQLVALRGGGLVGPLAGARTRALRDGQRAVDDLRPVVEVLGGLPRIIGAGEHRYLLLLTNPGEERPGGGFIGAVGTVTYRDGQLVSQSFQGAEFANGRIPVEPAPRPLDYYLFHGEPMQLSDANWSPDFPTSAANVARLYTAATGQRIDGVIDVDPVALSYFLETLGPIHVPPYPQTVTAGNALRELNYITNKARPQDPGKVYLAEFGRIMIGELLHAPGPSYGALLSAARRGVHEKHVTFSFVDPSLEKLAVEAGADGRLAPAGAASSLLVNDANLSGTKGDLFVTRDFALTAHVGSGGAVTGSLTLQYRNPRPTTAADRNLLPNSGGAYRDYLRVFLPQGASLAGITLSTGGAPQRVTPEEYGSELGRDYVALAMIIPPDGTLGVTFDFQQPPNAANPDPAGWSLMWQKQVNALTWPAHVTVTTADGRSAHWDFPLDADHRLSLGAR